MPIRAVFAEDNYLVREGTSALLAEVEEIDLVGVVVDRDTKSDRAVIRAGSTSTDSGEGSR